MTKLKLPPLPPRCIDHPHFRRGCTTCRTYNNAAERRRRRYRAYGGGQYPNEFVPAAPVGAAIAAMDGCGVSYVEIARRAGVTAQRLSYIKRGRQKYVRRVTADRIMAALAAYPTAMPSVGVARRLQALAAIGYGARALAPLIGRHRVTITQLRKPATSTVTPDTYSRVAKVYEDLLGTNPGPGRTPQLARSHAAEEGWLPPEAWTSATIDDPDAQPYSDPEAVEYVDEVKLAQVRVGRTLFTELTRTEQRVLLMEHLANGRTAQMFIHRYRPTGLRSDSQLAASWREATRRLRAEFVDLNWGRRL